MFTVLRFQKDIDSTKLRIGHLKINARVRVFAFGSSYIFNTNVRISMLVEAESCLKAVKNIIAKDFVIMTRGFVIIAKGFVIIARGFVIIAKGFVIIAKRFVIMARAFARKAKGFVIKAKGFVMMAKAFVNMIRAVVFERGEMLCICHLRLTIENCDRQLFESECMHFVGLLLKLCDGKKIQVVEQNVQRVSDLKNYLRERKVPQGVGQKMKFPFN